MLLEVERVISRYDDYYDAIDKIYFDDPVEISFFALSDFVYSNISQGIAKLDSIAYCKLYFSFN